MGFHPINPGSIPGKSEMFNFNSLFNFYKTFIMTPSKKFKINLFSFSNVLDLKKYYGVVIQTWYSVENKIFNNNIKSYYTNYYEEFNLLSYVIFFFFHLCSVCCICNFIIKFF